MQPSAAFKARVRARLTQQMLAHPRRRSSRFNFAFMRLAGNFAIVLMIFLMAGTAYAQSALPGTTFYEWKLISENAWRAVSADPIRTDLAIAERRMNELIAVSNDPALQPRALEAYLEVTARLKSEATVENEALILQTLDSQLEELEESGIPVPQIIDEDILPQLEETLPAPVAPVATLLPLTEIPQVNPASQAPAVTTPISSKIPQINPTPLPNIVPTVQALPNIIPTIQLPDIIPTSEVPTLLP